MKKLVLILMTLTLVGSILAGCSGGGDAAGAGDKKPDAAAPKTDK